MKGPPADLASIDKCLDMTRAHLVMAVLADDRYGCCCRDPVATHIGISLSPATFMLSLAAGFARRVKGEAYPMAYQGINRNNKIKFQAI